MWSRKEGWQGQTGVESIMGLKGSFLEILGPAEGRSDLVISGAYQGNMQRFWEVMWYLGSNSGPHEDKASAL